MADSLRKGSDMMLIECPQTGERCLVESLEGYDGWVVLSEDASPPPSAHCGWDCKKKRWVEDEPAARRAARRAEIRDPERLLTIIEDLEARLTALEATIIVT